MQMAGLSGNVQNASHTAGFLLGQIDGNPERARNKNQELYDIGPEYGGQATKNCVEGCQPSHQDNGQAKRQTGRHRKRQR